MCIAGVPRVLADSAPPELAPDVADADWRPFGECACQCGDHAVGLTRVLAGLCKECGSISMFGRCCHPEWHICPLNTVPQHQQQWREATRTHTLPTERHSQMEQNRYLLFR
jgi:hypothetical protein